MNLKDFLKETEIIDFSNQKIQKLANELSRGSENDIDIAKNCFEFVRDEIRHTGDNKDNITTYKASDVLQHQTGWCYAKSHLSLKRYKTYDEMINNFSDIKANQVTTHRREMN